MNEVIDFVKRVFEEMYQLEFKNLSLKHSTEELELESEVLRDKYFHGTRHGIGIWSDRHRTPENFSRPMYSQSKVKAPIIFQVKEYDDAKWGKVYKVYASTTISIDDSYSVIHFVAKHGGQWKIVGQYDFLLGVYEHRYGENFDHLKTPTAIRKLQAPSDSLDLEEYNSD
jgi:hypothetical protein